MTLTTLNYIHGLLQHEEEVRLAAKKKAWEIYDEAEAAEADNVQTLRQVVEQTRASYNEANSALREFETVDWIGR